MALEKFTPKEYPTSTKFNTMVDAIEGKVDKAEGKGLSTNDYTNVDKAVVAQIPSDLVDSTKGTKGQVLTRTASGSAEWKDAQGGGGTTDYSELTNKPQIGGVTLSGNKSASDLGLASASSLDGKVDKVEGKGLSTNDYTTAEKAQVAKIATLEANQTTIDDIKDAMEELPDGTAVSAQVAINTATLTSIAGGDKNITTEASSGYWDSNLNAQAFNGTNRVTIDLSDVPTGSTITYTANTVNATYNAFIDESGSVISKWQSTGEQTKDIPSNAVSLKLSEIASSKSEWTVKVTIPSQFANMKTVVEELEDLPDYLTIQNVTPTLYADGKYVHSNGSLEGWTCQVKKVDITNADRVYLTLWAYASMSVAFYRKETTDTSKLGTYLIKAIKLADLRTGDGLVSLILDVPTDAEMMLCSELKGHQTECKYAVRAMPNFSVKASDVQTLLFGLMGTAIKQKSLSGKKISALGDSYTIGLNSNDNTYIKMLADDNDITLQNLGVAGTRLAGTEDGAMHNRYSSVANDANIVVVFGGVNDAYIKATEESAGDVSSTDTNTICGALNTIINGLKAKNSSYDIIVVTPWRFLYTDWETEVHNAIISVCRNKGVKYVDLWSNRLLDMSCKSNKDLLMDGIHPSYTGHKIIESLLCNELTRS